MATKHRLTTSPDTKKIYEAWIDIKRKCYDSSSAEYLRYGLKGRKLSEEWLESPTDFVDYMLSLPNFDLSKSIDRIDNTKGYERGNLQWANHKQQARNRSKYSVNSSGVTGVRFIIIGKVTYVRAEWSDLETGKTKCKNFSTFRYGLFPAFQKACDYRNLMIQNLNKQGAGYSSSHGH